MLVYLSGLWLKGWCAGRQLKLGLQLENTFIVEKLDDYFHKYSIGLDYKMSEKGENVSFPKPKLTS